MKLSPKSLAPSLTGEERTCFARFLGLSSLPIVFLELLGNRVLQAQRIEGSKVRSLLQPVQVTSDLDWSSRFSTVCDSDPSLAHLRLTYPSCLPTVPVRTPASLWEALLPYPYCRFAWVFEPRPSCDARIFPSRWEDSLRDLWQALKEMESWLNRSELSCWYLTREHEVLPLLFQSMQGKRTRVGIAPEFASLIGAHPSSQSVSDALTDHFGIRVAVHVSSWTAPADSPEIISALAKSLRDVTRPGQAAGSEVSHSPLTELIL